MESAPRPQNNGEAPLDDESAEKEKNIEGFTSRELERLAKITGRVPDDEGVITLNLALRYRKYQQALELVGKTDRSNTENPNTQTMIQRETMEDIATLKRELEEAMYLYDKRFAEMDEQNRRKEAKDSYRRHERAESGATHEEPGYWAKAQEARNSRREQYEQRRDAAAEDLASKLDGIVGDVEGSEIFKTYEWNKEEYPEEPVRDRRDGLDGAGKQGLFVDGKYDWKLYPHAPEKGNPDDGNGENPNPEEDPDNKVDIGVKIEGIEQEFEEDRKERLKELEDRLENLRPDIAELYARNRRLIVGGENRAQFNKVRGEYGKLMDEYLRLKAGQNYEKGKHEIADRLETRIEELTSEIEQKLTEFCGGDPEHSTKTQEEVDAEKARLVEEAEKKLRDEYGEMTEAVKKMINAEFVQSFVDEELKLEEATTDALDNGSLCRKFVNKVLNNKKLKIVLGVAAVAGLAVTGGMLAAGLAAGTMAVGLSFTAGGVAAGAAKGAFGGVLMSRQNSKNSAVRGFTSEEEIREGLESIDVTDKNSDTANVADYLMSQYKEANDTDRSSNRKKTLISAGIGAAIGGLTSGIQISNIESTVQTSQGITGYEPTEVHAANLDNVNIPKGHGAMDTFTQLGGKPGDYQKFQDIMFSYDQKYGLVPGSNGETSGVGGLVGRFAHTYPGRINTWPDVVQSYMTEVADEAARQGLIPSVTTGGGPIYGTITKIVETEVPNAFLNFLTRATALVGATSIGGATSNSETVRYNNDSETPAPEGGEGGGETPAPEGGEGGGEGGGETPAPEGGEGGGEGGGETPAPEGGEGGEGSGETPAPEGGEGGGETPAPEGGEGGEGSGETPAPEGGEGGEGNENRERANNDLEFRRQIIDTIGDQIGITGIDIVAATSDFEIKGQSVFNARAESWWDSLNDEAKEAVRNFERSIDDSERGTNLLKDWLQNRGEL